MKIAVILLAAVALWSAHADDQLVLEPVPVARAEDDNTGRFLFGGGTYTIAGIFPTNTLTTTKTTYITVSTTATTATVISCIPSTYFSTTAGCRRRRAIFEDSGLDASLIKPQTPVEPSVVADVKREEVVPEIMSSEADAADQVENGHHSLQKRAIYSYSTFFITSTVTSYTFTSTTYTKTLKIGSTTSVLICLPSGLSVC